MAAARTGREARPLPGIDARRGAGAVGTQDASNEAMVGGKALQGVRKGKNF